MEPGAPRRGREIRQAHARRQIHRPEEPRQADRQTVRGVREPAGHGPQGPALPFMTAQGTPPDDAQTTGRPGRDRTGPPGVPGVPQPHPRDRRTRPKDPPSWARHPPDNRIGLFKRQARGVRQQDQGHHPHGLRLPPREQSHRPRHAPPRRTRHTPTTTKNPTHENSRSLFFVLSRKTAGRQLIFAV